MKLWGCITALVTPFSPGGEVDFGKLGELIDFQIGHGADAILVLGTTGEAATASPGEDDAVCAFAVRHTAGRVPLLAGSGSNCTRTMAEKSRRYEALGADGLLLSAPYYNKANTAGMVRHFAAAADGVKIPCLLYNVPGRTGCAIPEEAVKELSAHPNIAGIKEASGDLGYACRIARYQGEDFALYAGSDDTALPMLALGARGIISVAANLIPGEIHAMAERFLAGDTAGAREIQLRYLPLIRCLFLEVNPIPVKEALDLLGWEVGGCRLPLAPMEPGHRRALRAAMEEVGLL